MLAAMYWFDVFDKILMGIYIFELALKLYAQRERFLDSGWNIFDAFIVSISVVETAMYTVLNDSSSLSPSIFRLFRVFKALRAMRALRAISFLQNLQLIISTLFRSIPAMGSIILLLMLLLYIFAIIFVTLYQDLFPDRFDNLWTAMFSLFQLITLDDWSWYYMTVLEKDPDGAPQLMILMSLFIVLETFIVLNLMIAVIVNSLERANERKRQRKLRQQEQRAKSSGNVEDVSDLTSQDSGRKRKRKRKRKPSKRDRQRRRTSDPKGASSFKEGTSPRNASHRGSRKSSLPFALGENKTAVNEEESQGSGSEDSGDEADMNRLKTPAPAFLKNGAIPYWQRELQPEVLALLASLDHNHHVLFEQQRLLDDLVDVTAPKQATN
ncbi:Sodium channel protein type 11 subunit alpha [Hondaea fermentalgiana]|uniref:Sodium channel protein type 11 subunit alpha n=1 Tax=Hondaea fermentalgiana TaxID=2315210 RepID=A0A2R5GST5_9STRA|nr:Sodium channel protein type 11 subunit alpha [Hondaea fermentalgiana]|eukprot:GBG31713.1 Sodium channel protein type 11 subunit alpha [Hondaea fermentalgiana]